MLRRYWQTFNPDARPGDLKGRGAVAAVALPYELINRTNPAMDGTAFTGRMVRGPGGRLLMLIGMGNATLLENKNLEDPSRPEDWVPAEGDGHVVVDWDGAPTTKHEDYRLHVFGHGYTCEAQGTVLKNWLFVIPDGVAAASGASEPAGAGSGGAKGVAMNSTNLRAGNLRQQGGVSMAACAALCDATPACQAWVFERLQGPGGLGECFLKNSEFCVNPPSDPCGGRASPQGVCPCTAGIKPGAAQKPCAPRPAPGPAPPRPPKVGRACGRMGFASASLNGPYKYCQFVEQPDPQGLDDPGGPGSNCDSWPGDLIQAADGSLFFVNGWGNIYKSANGTTMAFKRLGNATIARPAPAQSFDDLHQIEFTFLPPAGAVGSGGGGGGRWSLFHASYSSANHNPHATRADYGFKQAIGMYTFDWGA